MRRILAVVAALTLAVVGTVSCQKGQTMWAPCAPAADGNLTGTDGTWVLICRNGRWEPTMTVAEWVAILQGKKITIGPLPSPPKPPISPTPPPTTAPPTLPVPSAGPGVVAGYDHTCAKFTAGKVECWGSNQYGQLGNGTNSGTVDPNATPTEVAGLTGVVELAAGGHHTCALLGGGTVKCWGRNTFGQLGNATNNGGTNPNPVPATVPGLTGVVGLAAGGMHTCALKANATVTCWGANGYGQLGNATNNSGGDSPTPWPTPTAVVGLSGVTALTAGKWFTCALLSDGTAKCWGLNLRGQLGTSTNIGTTNPNPVPQLLTALDAHMGDVTELSTGYEHTCALGDDDTVACWGVNAYGQLGHSDGVGELSANAQPTTVAGLSDVSELDAGGEFTCALSNGTPWCWGDNVRGQLGNPNSGEETSSATPLWVSLIEALQLAVGGSHACALRSSGEIYCWGSNEHGQLGRDTNVGTTEPTPTPARVSAYICNGISSDEIVTGC